jgi:hypothetical protein
LTHTAAPAAAIPIAVNLAAAGRAAIAQEEFVMEPIFLGLDAAALICIPLMIGGFVFAVWYGATQFSIGIDAEEQARRQAASLIEKERALGKREQKAA